VRQAAAGGATVERRVAARGFALAGRPVRFELAPAGPGCGIRFNRAVRSRPCEAHVSGHATCLGSGQSRVAMVEHLLAACYGEGITDLQVRVEGGALPLLDGSAEPYRRLLVRAGRVSFGNGPEPLRLRRPVFVSLGARFVAVLPADRLTVNCAVDLPGVGQQFFRYRHSRASFARDLARARTFGPDSAATRPKTGRRKGLGFSLKSVAGFAYPAKRRFENEPCRHKTLDFIGDLGLLGRPLCAEVFAFRPGHRLNIALVRHLERSIEP